MHGDFVHALAELGIFIGHEDSANAAVLRGPSSAGIVGAIDAAGRDGDVEAARVRWVLQNRVQRESAIAGHPARAMRMIEQAAHERPVLAAIARFKKRGRLDAAVENVRLIGRAERDLPDIFERDAGIGGKTDGRFLRIGPGLAEVVGETQERAPDALGGSPDAMAAGAAVEGHGIDAVAVKIRAA